jgi:hypothetical protein
MFGFRKILIQDDETAIDTTDLIDVLPDNRTPVCTEKLDMRVVMVKSCAVERHGS